LAYPWHTRCYVAGMPSQITKSVKVIVRHSARRQKTGELAVVLLADHLLASLRAIPLERDSVGPDQPFRSHNSKLQSDARVWAHRIEHIFELAGITEVNTEQRIRKPHVQMFRDSCAVWHLTHGVSLKSVARMLGHASSKTTEAAYLPRVREMQDSHIEEMRKAQGGLNRGKGKIVAMKRG